MMPFSGFDLITRLQNVHKSAQANDTVGSARVISVFAPKGGVGKTTIAFNLAVALGQSGERTVLIDGSLQFGDLRALLKVPVDAPPILDLPTDRIAESDLADVLWRDPSGIDILLAPPRVEMAEMVTTRDIDKVLSLLRRVYTVVVIDTPSMINDLNLAFLDTPDTIVEVVTYDSTTIHNTIAHGRRLPDDRVPGVEGPLPRQSRGLAGRHRPAAARARPGPGAGASRRVGWPPRRAIEQRWRAVRPGEPCRGDQSGHRADRQRARRRPPGRRRGAPLRDGRGPGRVADPRPSACSTRAWAG